MGVAVVSFGPQPRDHPIRPLLVGDDAGAHLRGVAAEVDAAHRLDARGHRLLAHRVDAGAHAPATILVVDDTPVNLTLMAELLSEHYRVKVAANGPRALRIALVLLAVAAVVVADDLGHVGQAREGRLEAAVVEARPAVQQHQGGLLPHEGAVGHQAGALDVDEEADAGFDLDAHAADCARHRRRRVGQLRPRTASPSPTGCPSPPCGGLGGGVYDRVVPAAAGRR